MFGGNAIGFRLDVLDLLGRDLLVIEQADQRLDRRLDVAAARVGLDVAVGDAERRRRRQHHRAGALGAGERKSLHEAVTPFVTLGGPSTPCSASAPACLRARGRGRRAGA
jgi:hypothetical protein